MAVRFDDEVRGLLTEGARRTPLSKQELIRRTLRQFLRVVIDQEVSTPVKRITNIEPWPRGALAKAWKKTDQEWARSEAAAMAARRPPRMDN